jgi:DNA modification methylase
MEDKLNKIIHGDALELLKGIPDNSIDCVVTSPPYWALRDYGMPGQIGLESSFEEYINKLCHIFDEVKRILKPSGTCWINLGDTYSSENTLCQIPSRFAIEMCNRGWILRNEIIWHKPNCMPQSVKNRFTVDFEKVFFFVKNKKYFFNQQYDPANYDGRKQEIMRGSAKYSGIVVPGNAPHTFAERGHKRWQMKNGIRVRNKRSVWSISNKPLKEAHFATFPEALVEIPIKAGCPPGGVVLDPFMGAGTTAMVAQKLGMNYIGFELNQDYINISDIRLMSDLTKIPGSLFQK